MPKIKFSHLTKKLMDANGNLIDSAKLLLVSVIPMDDITFSADFIQYETDGLHAIPFSQFFLLLIFLRPDGEIFTTVRPRHGSDQSFKASKVTKEQYYRGLVGQEFEVVITG
jgi:hypothetical protein